jgi:hypothetical protein
LLTLGKPTAGLGKRGGYLLCVNLSRCLAGIQASLGLLRLLVRLPSVSGPK